jgi:DNA-binding transcriptional LysR family regulator
LPLNALRAFEAVGNEGSFTAAAAALHVSQSALSRHVARLEEFVGRRLLDRRPGGVALTRAGAALLAALETSFDRIHVAIETLRAADSPRIIRVHMPPTFLQVVGMEFLRAFRAAFPDILVDVSSTNGVGPPQGRSHDLVVTFDRPKVDDSVRDLLWLVDCTPACSPAFAEACAGMDLAAFLRAGELLHTKLEGQPFGALWARYGAELQLDVRPERGLAFDTEALAVRFAAAGGGVVLLDTVMWAGELAAGRLVTPYAATRPTGFGYYLSVQPDDLPDPAIALCRAWLLQRFAQRPAAQP